MTVPPPTAAPPTNPVVRFLDSAIVLGVGLTLVGVGLFVITLTARQAVHDDKVLIVGAVVAILGALMISPAAMGGALRSLGLAVNQVWPGGRRVGDPPAGGQG